MHFRIYRPIQCFWLIALQRGYFFSVWHNVFAIIISAAEKYLNFTFLGAFRPVMSISMSKSILIHSWSITWPKISIDVEAHILLLAFSRKFYFRSRWNTFMIWFMWSFILLLNIIISFIYICKKSKSPNKSFMTWLKNKGTFVHPIGIL